MRDVAKGTSRQSQRGMSPNSDQSYFERLCPLPYGCACQTTPKGRRTGPCRPRNLDGFLRTYGFIVTNGSHPVLRTIDAIPKGAGLRLSTLARATKRATRSGKTTRASAKALAGLQ
ncbi:uncharacterized protein LOC132704961 [Cylas formicarius]|uniref:uncharacterized protein LOC132704961 n=1 Tax=Cylas formicarius TaxID=197179 RepID=UPI0029589A89|nr:uncharacterized protein LOC132704961 [Cylas formicarius]